MLLRYPAVYLGRSLKFYPFPEVEVFSGDSEISYETPYSVWTLLSSSFLKALDTVNILNLCIKTSAANKLSQIHTLSGYPALWNRE